MKCGTVQKPAKQRTDICIGEILYYLFWSIMLAAKGLGLYEGMLYYNIALILSFSCIILKLLLEKHTIRELLIEGALLSLGVMIYVTTSDKAPLINILMVIGLKNVPIKRVFKVGLVVWSACFTWRTIMEVTGISTGLALVHEKMGLGPIIRWSFGYPHPNVLQISYAVLVAFILYMVNCDGKKYMALVGVLFLGNCYVFLYSVSYTGVILVTLFLGISCYFRLRKSFSRLEKILMQSILPVCVSVSLIAPLIIDTSGIIRKIGEFLNKAVNNRFLASSVYLSCGLAPFGKNLASMNFSFALDSSYVGLLVNNGWIIFIIVIAAYYFTIRNYVETNRRKELAIILTFLITGISEPFLFNTSFKNLSLLFIGEALFQWTCNKKGSKFGLNLSTIGRTIYYPANSICLYFEKCREQIINKKIKLALVIIVGGMTASILYLVMNPAPEAVYIAVGNTDCGTREEVFLDQSKLPADFKGRILEYHGIDKPMYCFNGNIIKVEMLRGIISWFLFGGSFFGGIGIAVFLLKKEENQDEKRII